MERIKELIREFEDSDVALRIEYHLEHNNILKTLGYITYVTGLLLLSMPGECYKAVSKQVDVGIEKVTKWWKY